MRFIIREQPYEKPVAAGLLRYEQDGQPTGTVEEWRLTDVAEGYRFLRIDLDAREGASGDTYLYHLILSPENRLERVKFRFFNAQKIISGDVLIEDDVMTLLRDVKGHQGGEHFEETADTSGQPLFWLPSTIGLGLLADSKPTADGVPALTLDKTADFAFNHVTVNLSLGEKEMLAVAQRDVVARPLSIRWQDQARTIWLDDHDFPVKMVRGDGLTAVETRNIRY